MGWAVIYVTTQPDGFLFSNHTYVFPSLVEAERFVKGLGDGMVLMAKVRGVTVSRDFVTEHGFAEGLKWHSSVSGTMFR